MITRHIRGKKNGFSVESQGKKYSNPCTDRELIFFMMKLNRNSDTWQACVGEIRVGWRKLIEIEELLARNREEGLYFSYLFSFLRIYNRNFSTLSQVFLFFIDDIKYICQRNEKSITNVFVYCIRICNKVYSLTVDSLKFSQEIRNSFPFEFNINLTIILNFCIFHFRDFLCLSNINIRYISLRKHEITFQK